jgi:hypothetical protein
MEIGDTEKKEIKVGLMAEAYNKLLYKLLGRLRLEGQWFQDSPHK